MSKINKIQNQIQVKIDTADSLWSLMSTMDELFILLEEIKFSDTLEGIYGRQRKDRIIEDLKVFDLESILSDYEYMQNDFKEAEKEIEKLESDIEDKDKEIEKGDDRITELENEIIELKEKIEDYEERERSNEN